MNMNLVFKGLLVLIVFMQASWGNSPFDRNSLLGRLANLAAASLPYVDEAVEKLHLEKFKYEIRLYEDFEIVVLMKELEDRGSGELSREKFQILKEEIERRGIKLRSAGSLIAQLGYNLNKAQRADTFFKAFDEIAAQDPNPSETHRIALDKFVSENVENIFALRPPPSLEQIQRMHRYIKRESASIALIDGFIKRGFAEALESARTAFDFFRLFDKFVDRFPNPPSLIRGILDQFVIANARAIFALNPSFAQIKSLNKYIRIAGTSVALLEQVLKKAKTASDFFNVFSAFASYIRDPSDAYKNALEKFFKGHADALVALDLSPEHIRQLNDYMGRSSIIIELRMATRRRYGRASDSVCRRLFDQLL